MTLPRTIALVLVLIILGTAFFVAKPDPPEMVQAVSEDGMARVEALFHQGGGVKLRGVTLRLRQENGDSSTSRVSPIYEIVRKGGYGELGGTFSLVSLLDPSSHALGYWDTDEEAWNVQDISTYNVGAFSSGTTLSPQSIKWALFQQQDIEIPRRYEQLVSELIENRSEKTKRAHITLSYAFEPDDYVLIRSARVTAACGGNLQAPRGRTETEEIALPVTLTVNGREREGSIRVRAKWELENGCAEGEAFERVD